MDEIVRYVNAVSVDEGKNSENNLQRIVLALCILRKDCCIQRSIKVVVHCWDVDPVIKNSITSTQPPPDLNFRIDLTGI